MNKFFDRFFFIGGGILLLSPFFVLRYLLYPFVLGKATIIQIVVALFFPLTALTIFSLRKTVFNKKQFLTWAIVVYAAVLILTATTGISPRQSFWGTSDRSLGVFNILHLLTAYFIFLIVLKEAKARKHLIVFTVLTGFAVSIMGIFEYFSTNGSRVMGFFGNPILFASYLIFPLFLSLIFFTKGIFWKRIIFFAICLTILASFLFAQSRGALVGVILGGIIVAATILWTSAGKKKSILFKAVGIIAVVAIIIFILAKSGNHTAISLTRRFTRMSLQDASGDQRLRLYAIALHAAGDRPLFGWGPENFDYAFDRNYDPALLKYGVSETWVDRSHNTYLDTLVMSGILGLASYAAIFAAAFVMLRRSVVSGAHDIREAGILGALIAAYGVANFFAFDSPPSFVYFMFVLAYINAPFLKDGNKNIESKKSRGYIILAAGILVAFISIIFTLRNAWAGRSMLRFSALPPVAVNERLREIDGMLRVNSPLTRDFRLRFANTAFLDAGNLPKKDADITLSRAIEEMEKNIKEAPEDFSYRFALGNLYLERGMLIDVANFDRAEEIFSSAEPLSPNRQSLFFQWASVEYLKKDFEKAIFLLKRVVAVDPSVGQSHWRLGISYAYNGEVPKAIEEWRTALWKGYDPEIIYYKTRTGAGEVKIDNINFAPDIKNEREFVLNIALRERDFDIFRVLMILSIESVTGEVKGGLYAKLAVAELEAGNFSGARAALKRAIEYDPSAQEEAELFLRDISSREQAAAGKK